MNPLQLRQILQLLPGPQVWVLWDPLEESIATLPLESGEIAVVLLSDANLALSAFGPERKIPAQPFPTQMGVTLALSYVMTGQAQVVRIFRPQGPLDLKMTDC